MLIVASDKQSSSDNRQRKVGCTAKMKDPPVSVRPLFQNVIKGTLSGPSKITNIGPCKVIVIFILNLVARTPTLFPTLTKDTIYSKGQM